MAMLRLQGNSQPLEAALDAAGCAVTREGRDLSGPDIAWEVPTRGCVYGVALNFRGALAALGAALYEPPYKAPPRAPVMYIKPRNTWRPHLAPVPIPADVQAVEIGATLGVVMARDAARVPAERALAYVAGYTIINDITAPHESLFRPALRQKCRDGFCPIGPWIIRRDDLPHFKSLTIRAYVNGEQRMAGSTAELIRPVDQLIADVSDFMTLRAGDVLAIGVPGQPALARAGDRVAVEVEGLGRLENPLIAQPLRSPGSAP
jgi:5-oxopent-3-ene-1,2,5-tricarboxylate decarboxylase/2-hydroxyhepta-2,4-diene-1,7-dioate isomerase